MKANCIPLGFLLAMALASPSSATVIETFQDGSAGSPIWGEFGLDAGVGQTFTLQAGQDTVLDSISFNLDDFAENSATHTTIDFRLYVYEWNTTSLIPDSSAQLFQSPILTTDGLQPFQTFVVPTGGIPLTIGTPYIWFFSAAGLFSISPPEFGGADWGFDLGNPYPYGTSYRRSGGSCCFANLFNSGWGAMAGGDLAFRMVLSAPEPAPAGLVASALVASLVILRRDRLRSL